MLELMILGFLSEEPLHGYELRRRIEQLHGHARPISDGSLYPAIKRLMGRGLVSGHAEQGRAGMGRRVLQISEAGRHAALEMVRDAHGADISDLNRFIVILAFLSLLPDKNERDAVLRRRADFLAHPTSFFSDTNGPVRRADVTDPYRKGIFEIAGAANRAERAWLESVLAGSSPDGTTHRDEVPGSQNTSERNQHVEHPCNTQHHTDARRLV